MSSLSWLMVTYPPAANCSTNISKWHGRSRPFLNALGIWSLAGLDLWHVGEAENVAFAYFEQRLQLESLLWPQPCTQGLAHRSTPWEPLYIFVASVSSSPASVPGLVSVAGKAANPPPASLYLCPRLSPQPLCWIIIPILQMSTWRTQRA